MKKLLAFIISLNLVCTGMLARAEYLNPFEVRAAAADIASVKNYSIPVYKEEILKFSLTNLEQRKIIEGEDFLGFTVISLPEKEDGALYLKNKKVKLYDYIPCESVDSFSFVPKSGALSADFTVLLNGAKSDTVSIAVKITGEKKNPPVIEDGKFTTAPGISIKGSIMLESESNAEIQLIDMPQKGDIVLSGAGFIYEPFAAVSGKDYFTVCAVDGIGNYSDTATIEIDIESLQTQFRYSDMQGNPSQYAAVKLYENGVMTGKKIGGEWFFGPENRVTKGDFLVMVITACGIKPGAAINTGLPGDDKIPAWLKPYVKAGVEAGIIEAGKPFNYSEIPLRAEAVMMTANAAKINDVKDVLLPMDDKSSIPAWALKSYKELSAYRMLDLYDTMAYPEKELDNSYSADLIWQLYKYSNT